MDLYTGIKSASVYRGGAEIVRRGAADLEAGTQTLYVHGISQSSQIDTARLFCQEGLSCSDLRFVDRFGGEEDPKVTELRERIAALEKHIEVRELQVKLWKDNGNFSSRDQQPAAEVQEYIEKLAERLESLNKDILDTKKKIEGLNKQIEELQKDGSQPVLAAEVTAEKAGRFTFELRYFENGAWWRPVYEIHSDGEAPLAMRMRANIRQNTYEDWEGIELSLLTGSPNAAGTVFGFEVTSGTVSNEIKARRTDDGTVKGLHSGYSAMGSGKFTGGTTVLTPGMHRIMVEYDHRNTLAPESIRGTTIYIDGENVYHSNWLSWIDRKTTLFSIGGAAITNTPTDVLTGLKVKNLTFFGGMFKDQATGADRFATLNGEAVADADKNIELVRLFGLKPEGDVGVVFAVDAFAVGEDGALVKPKVVPSLANGSVVVQGSEAIGAAAEWHDVKTLSASETANGVTLDAATCGLFRFFKLVVK